MVRALFFILLAMTAACASAPRAGAGAAASPAKIAEAELSARVKTALLNDAIVGTRRIDVQVAVDQVTLTGRVASEAERDRALAIARAVTGVRAVTSGLEIRP